MLTGRWIISHRCSWMAVYVYCSNAQIKSHSNYLACMSLYSLNCPSVISSPSMLFICYGETPLVKCGPQSFSLILINHPHQTLFIYCNYYSANISFPHYTVNPLFPAKPVRLTTSLNRWGKVFWLCCVQVPRCCWRR